MLQAYIYWIVPFFSFSQQANGVIMGKNNPNTTLYLLKLQPHIVLYLLFKKEGKWKSDELNPQPSFNCHCLPTYYQSSAKGWDSTVAEVQISQLKQSFRKHPILSKLPESNASQTQLEDFCLAFLTLQPTLPQMKWTCKGFFPCTPSEKSMAW